MFKFPVFLLIVQMQCGASFVDQFCCLCFVCVCHTVLSFPCCWEKDGLLAFLYVKFSSAFVTLPYGVLGKVGYLIVLIPDICLLSYFIKQPHSHIFFLS